MVSYLSYFDDLFDRKYEVTVQQLFFYRVLLLGLVEKSTKPPYIDSNYFFLFMRFVRVQVVQPYSSTGMATA